MSTLHLNRALQLGLLLALILLRGEAFAQVRVDGVNLQSLAGTAEAGYGGQVSPQQPGSHDLGVGGSVSTNGYYYSPNFLSFGISGFYDRAQSDADSTSVENSSGYTVNSRIFAGSAIPGSVSLSQDWGQNSSYGLLGLNGLDSTTNNKSFGVSWIFKKLPIIRNLSVGFSDTTTDVSILGLGANSTVNTKAYTIGTSGYRFAGFSLSLGYEHLLINSEGNLYGGTENGGTTATTSGSTSMNMYHVLTGRVLPWNRGQFTLSAYRTSSDSISQGQSSSNTTDELDASLTSRVWRLPLSANLDYNDNVFGSVLQQYNAQGQTVPISESTPRTGSLLMNLSTSYTFPYSIFVTGFISRQEEYLQFGSVGATSLGANANYHFGKRLEGLTVMFGMNDSASQQGNNGAGLIANATYIRRFGNWKTTSNISYNQNVQTMLALYTTSGMSSSSMIRREWENGLGLSMSGAYGRSLFVQQQGSSSSQASLNAGASWAKQSVSASWTESSGTVIISSQGLVQVTTPGLVTNLTQPFSGRSYALGYGNHLVKRLSFNFGWSKSDSTSSGLGLLSNVSSEQYIGSLSGNFRKLTLVANATHVHQGASTLTSLPTTTTVFYFGVSRFFNFF